MIQKTEFVSAYLDQWVWVRLAQIASCRRSSDFDRRLMAAVLAARQAGVVFPLSSTHYEETHKIPDEIWRRTMAKTMAHISEGQTLRSRHVLLREQLLLVMHQQFGRPYFKPVPPRVLGAGVHWAYQGEQHSLQITGPQHLVKKASQRMTPDMLCRLSQWAEITFLGGPPDEAVEMMRKEYGYQPEVAETSARSRLEWEELYVDILGNDPVSNAELQARVEARELIHEHVDLIGKTFREYGVSFANAFGVESEPSRKTRPRIRRFFDGMPSFRVAVDMKVKLFQNSRHNWTINDLRDIDAMSLAVPYCHLVVPDKDAADSIRRFSVDERYQTIVVNQLEDLPDALDELSHKASQAKAAVGPWARIFPSGDSYKPLSPIELDSLAKGNLDPGDVSALLTPDEVNQVALAYVAVS